MSPSELEIRLRRLEDREAIRELVGRYGYVIDNRDLEGVAELFCEDAILESRDGVMQARGRAAIIELYKGRYAALGPTFHYTHDHAITLHETDPDVATGIIASHAEVTRNGEAMLAAIRYFDDYRREDGRWRFAKRSLAFFYYTPAGQYVDTMTSTLRQRAYGDQRPADWPETLETWKRYKAREAGS